MLRTCRVQRDRFFDACENIGKLRILALCVDDAVGCDVRDAHRPCESHELVVAFGVGRRKVMLELEIATIAKQRAQRIDALRIGHRAERDQTIAAAVEIPVLQSCIAFAAAQLRARNQLTQIGITAFSSTRRVVSSSVSSLPMIAAMPARRAVPAKRTAP